MLCRLWCGIWGGWYRKAKSNRHLWAPTTLLAYGCVPQARHPSLLRPVQRSLSDGPAPVSPHYIPSNFAFWAANSSSVRIPSCFSFPSLSSCATVSSETPPSSGAA